jgi:ABC-type Fe3+-hydroxamate transport system substrate-binding protein
MIADSVPRRIASLAPSLTEFLVVIGAADRLVAVSDYCPLPPGLILPRLGGMSNPDLALLQSLNPDLVLLDRSLGGPTAAALDLNLPSYVIAVRSVAGALDQLADLARVLGVTAAAAPLLADLHHAIDAAYARQYQRRMRRVLAFTWRDPWLAVGGDCYADDLLRLCGAENLALRLPGRSPRAGLEAFIRHNPHVILLADEPYPFELADCNAFWRFGDVHAVHRRSIHLCSGRLLTRFGLHLPEAIDALSDLIHQQA